MSGLSARIISHPSDNVEQAAPAVAPSTAPGIDPLAELLAEEGVMDRGTSRLDKVRAEISVLQSENRWEEIVTMFHPVEEKEPELVALGLDAQLRSELGFALGQLKRLDEAITELTVCVQREPDNFRFQSSLGYTLYRSVLAALQKEVVLHPAMRKERIKQAHVHMKRAQELLPDRVTNYYREGKMYKDIERKPELGLPLFARAVANWEAYPPELRDKRHQERKNYVKALYNLASCQLDRGRTSKALELISTCVEEDERSGYLKAEHKYFALGKIRFQMGNSQEALQALDFAATFIGSVEGDYIRELAARCHLALHKPEQAMKRIEEIPARARKPYVRWTEADTLGALGLPDKAEQVLLACIDRDRRGRHKGLLRLVKLAYRQGRFQEATKWAEQADRFHRDSYTTPYADGLFWWAACCLQLGSLDRAKELESDLAAHKPRYPWLAKLHQAIARFE